MSIVETVFPVFGEITNWLVGQFDGITELFYADGSLTFIGVTSLAALGIGICLLLINTVKDFIRFR